MENKSFLSIGVAVLTVFLLVGAIIGIVITYIQPAVKTETLLAYKSTCWYIFFFSCLYMVVVGFLRNAGRIVATIPFSKPLGYLCAAIIIGGFVYLFVSPIGLVNVVKKGDKFMVRCEGNYKVVNESQFKDAAFANIREILIMSMTGLIAALGAVSRQEPSSKNAKKKKTVADPL